MELELNRPHGLTNDVIPPTSTDRETAKLTQTAGKQEIQNDNIYPDIKEGEQEYAYVDVNSDTLPDDTKNKKGKEFVWKST